ncbi:hypothetical protein IMSHALPRED_001906 [Imshaugia aleurites]|uniref:Uncharacterized protein n=1 Tax=Imshaugia aleurites TaxID=172621 RepID=A0A8H3I489_9LECA|nr:hypothetical protein IMSHALPRED_001906 [Imshaugia aleurites]
MSRLWPHTLYAEDQPYSPAILTTHVLYRGFQTGAIVGPIVSAARYYAVRFFAKETPSARPSTSLPSTSLSAASLRSAGTGAVWGTGVLALVLAHRMWGREEIEWRDRAWRLLENRGQVEVDGWGVVGAVGGGVGVWRLGRGVSWRVRVGGVGVGSAVGVFGYMVWRHGVKGGKWEEAVPDVEGVTT